MTGMNRIRAERGLKNWSQKEVAEKLDVKEQQVRRWELGQAKPNIVLVCKLADLFDCSTDWLLGRTENRK